MQVLSTSNTGPDDIDSLGHVNFSAYTRRVLDGHWRMLDSIGLGPTTRAALGIHVWQRDFCSRFHREQFAGARLETSGQLVEVRADSLMMAYLVRNIDKGEVAAAFLYEAALVDRASLASSPVPDVLRWRWEAMAEPLPPEAAPRTTLPWPPRLDVTWRDLVARYGERGTVAMMGERRDKIVGEAECDEHGFQLPGVDIMFDFRPRAHQRAEGDFGPKVQTTDEVARFSFAWVETRAWTIAAPRKRDRLISVGAPLALMDRAQHARRWVFDITRGGLIAVTDSVGLSLDLDARKAVPIPGRIREELAPLLATEFV